MAYKPLEVDDIRLPTHVYYFVQSQESESTVLFSLGDRL